MRHTLKHDKPGFMLEWDFKSMTLERFKNVFKISITQPLQSLLNELNTNSKAELPPMLKAAILGLIYGLAEFWKHDMLLRNETVIKHLRKLFGSNTSRQVLFLHFESVKKIRKYCTSIINCNKGVIEPLFIRTRSFEEIESDFSGLDYKSLSILRQSVPGYSFPLLICWKISELVPSNCPDAFIESSIVPLTPEPTLKGYDSSPIICDVKKTRFLDLLVSSDDAFSSYTNENCVVCASSVQKLRFCGRCKVALYCSKEHQTEHWSTHKHHCKRLLSIRNKIFSPTPKTP